ncbi:hypothetical protein AUJ66_00480 [Candidatus Desantisbacteria bacterium CG1_02_38_46]|uniref:DUF2283 domain-containing protein n=1 Tax=Candidatus Desantisbacteria bacterium CG1_02_38_46 TaxID=1817893 RepID=A0A1J4SGW6_9BACT|nr:MAG: hypothetical protein AUJ66_00480 [Candidatus Desantisbacteria bacterium CG1_02_38_46]
MAKIAIAENVISEIYEATPHLLKFPETKMCIDYDKEADTLYISFRRPQKATESVMLKDKGLLVRYKDNQLVGITVLDASKKIHRTEIKIEEPKVTYKIHKRKK